MILEKGEMESFQSEIELVSGWSHGSTRYNLKSFLKNGLLRGYLGEQKCSFESHDQPGTEAGCRDLQVISGIPEWIGHGLNLNTSLMPLAENLPHVSRVV